LYILFCLSAYLNCNALHGRMLLVCVWNASKHLPRR